LVFLQINGARREKDLLLLCFSDSPHEFAIEGALLDLNLSANRIGDPGALALAAAIKVNCFLHTLVLSDNKICDPGAVAIAEALLVNSTIKSLNLAQNNISDEGGAAFSELLGKNSTIQELYLCTYKYSMTIQLVDCFKLKFSRRFLFQLSTRSSHQV
jgi:Ran GTPase-activating protein (RanGAP) involved in mRNA processing and transport